MREDAGLTNTKARLGRGLKERPTESQGWNLNIVEEELCAES